MHGNRREWAPIAHNALSSFFFPRSYHEKNWAVYFNLQFPKILHGQAVYYNLQFPKILHGLVYEERAHELGGKILNYHYSKRLIVLCQGFLVSRRKASNKAFNSLKTGEEGDFVPFVCNFTVKNYHIKRASSCSGDLTKLWVSSVAFPFILSCRLNAYRQTGAEVSILS